MKTFYSLVILAGMAITFVVLSALAQDAKAPDPKVREQFVALAKKFDDAWNKNDAAAMSVLYADDAIQAKGFWGMVSVRQGDTWKCQLETWNVTPKR